MKASRFAFVLLLIYAVALGPSCGRFEPQTINSKDALAVLVNYDNATSDDGMLKLVTGKEKEFEEAVINYRKSGGSPTADPWRAEPDSKVTILEGDQQYAIIQLAYVNSFTLKEESMKFRLEKVGGQWLIANHTDAAGVWWPDYLKP